MPVFRKEYVVSMKVAYQSGSDTSYEAAVRALEFADTLRARVYRYIKEFGPVTDIEIQEGLGIKGSTQRPRRIKLFEMELIECAGQKKTPSGRNANTWQIAGPSKQRELF